MSSGPLKAYKQLVASGELAEDRAQAHVAQRLQHLADELKNWTPGKKAGPLSVIGIGKPVTPPEGLYIWGAVGRGKSMLMDLFYEHAQVSSKRRIHFHAFMAETHERIFKWRQLEKEGKAKGSDPIPPVAKQIAEEAALLEVPLRKINTPAFSVFLFASWQHFLAQFRQTFSSFDETLQTSDF